VPSHLQLLEDAGCKFEDLQLKTVTWKHLVRSQRISRVDLLVLDVEGHELAVIDGMRGCTVLPDVLCVEFGHVGLGVIREQLERLGYAFDTTSNANAYFVKREALALFAFRHRTSSVQLHGDDAANRLPQESRVAELEEQNRFLRQRVAELLWLYEHITTSMGWRFIEVFRKIKERLLA
jgi:hypothetical protein